MYINNQQYEDALDLIRETIQRFSQTVNLQINIPEYNLQITTDKADPDFKNVMLVYNLLLSAAYIAMDQQQSQLAIKIYDQTFRFCVQNRISPSLVCYYIAVIAMQEQQYQLAYDYIQRARKQKMCDQNIMNQIRLLEFQICSILKRQINYKQLFILTFKADSFDYLYTAVKILIDNQLHTAYRTELQTLFKRLEEINETSISKVEYLNYLIYALKYQLLTGKTLKCASLLKAYQTTLEQLPEETNVQTLRFFIDAQEKLKNAINSIPETCHTRQRRRPADEAAIYRICETKNRSLSARLASAKTHLYDEFL